jgi:hypothetical protein
LLLSHPVLSPLPFRSYLSLSLSTEPPSTASEKRAAGHISVEEGEEEGGEERKRKRKIRWGVKKKNNNRG